MYDLTGFQRDVLYIIAGLDDPNGLTIKHELEKYYDTTINYGRLYPNLDALVFKGLVTKTEADGRTNAYSITRRGLGELTARRDWETETLHQENHPESEQSAAHPEVPLS